MVKFDLLPCYYTPGVYLVQVLVGKVNYFDYSLNTLYYYSGADLYNLTVNTFNDPPTIVKSPSPSDGPIEVHVGSTF